MAFLLLGRYCVGAPLEASAALTAHNEFLSTLYLSPEATAPEVFEALRAETPKHKLHEPDLVRYEKAFEAFLDQRWNVDCALGGESVDGLLNRKRGYVFVGVRLEQFELEVRSIPTRSATPEKPQWLRKGDLSVGSELSHALGEDARKAHEHAARMYQRAAKEVFRDATARIKPLPISRQHEPDWALCRFIVDTSLDCVQHRHGRER